MTVTARAQQLVDEDPTANSTERPEGSEPRGSVEELAVLLAQACIALPLFA